MKQCTADQATISQGFGHVEPEKRAQHIIVWCPAAQCPAHERQDCRLQPSKNYGSDWVKLIVSGFISATLSATVMLYWSPKSRHGSITEQAVSKPEPGKPATEELVKKVIDASPNTKSGTMKCYMSDWKPDDQEEKPRVSCKGSHAPLNHGVDGHACRDISDCVILNVE